jgi:hypothetical protein
MLDEWEANKKTNNNNNNITNNENTKQISLIEIICILESFQVNSQANYLAKLLLIRCYCYLGAVQRYRP